MDSQKKCEKCGSCVSVRVVSDLSGNGETYYMCPDCEEEMIESWDFDKQQPKSE